MAKRNVLGRGLGALIDDADRIYDTGIGINKIEMSRIEMNPFQPRSYFNEDSLKELSVSIKEIGIIQPLTVRKAENEKFQIIAGERRFRAAQIAGLKKIPAYIRDADDDNMLEMALIENIQREDLDAIEIAFSYQRLIDECNLTQEQLSERVGKKRPTITNYLRLLKLPAVIQKGIRDKKISMGHARAIINLPDSESQLLVYEKIIKNEFSVRKVEELVKSIAKGETDKISVLKISLPKEYTKFKKNLSGFLKSNVTLSVNNKGKGKIVIPFKSHKDFERIVDLIKKQQ